MLNSQNSVPDSTIDAGKVSTQAISRLRTVAHCRPDLLADERFTTNARRSAARDALRAIVVEVFARLTASEVIARLDAAQIANAQVNTMHEVWSHPQLRARNRWHDVATPVGAIPAPLPPGID